MSGTGNTRSEVRESMRGLMQEKRSNYHFFYLEIGLERELARVENDIRTMASHPTSKALLAKKCKQRTELLKAIEGMENTLTNMQTLGTQKALARAQQAQVHAIQAMNGVLKQANDMSNPKEIQRMVSEMEKQQMNFDMTNEMMNTALDSVYGDIDEEVDEEEDRVLFEVAGMKMKDVKNAAVKNHQMAMPERTRQAEMNGYRC